jgi:AbrB family looped-hinge helix DNA binding protein
MVEAVTKIDKAGRVVIPKAIRERMGLKEDSALLVAEAVGGVVILKKLDIDDLARRLREELKGKDLDRIADSVKDESNERARKERQAIRRGDKAILDAGARA